MVPGHGRRPALAEILLGNVNPSGKLPCIFVKRAEDLPYYDKDATSITYDLWHGYRKLDREGIEPAFPFGFGLSYTTFAYSNLKLEQAELRSGDTLVASVDVTNTGGVAGDEVVQLYVKRPWLGGGTGRRRNLGPLPAFRCSRARRRPYAWPCRSSTWPTTTQRPPGWSSRSHTP